MVNLYRAFLTPLTPRLAIIMLSTDVGPIKKPILRPCVASVPNLVLLSDMSP